MFLKILTVTKQFKTLGEIVEVDDAKAQTLIDNGIAEQTEAPAAVKAIDTQVAGMVEGVAERVATRMAAELTKQLGATGAKRLNHADSTVEVMPGNFKRYSLLRNFPNTAEGYKRAYRFGVWCLANYARNNVADPERREHVQRYVQMAKSMGIGMKQVRPEDDNDRDPLIGVTKGVGGEIIDLDTKASNEASNASSAFLVPDEFQQDLIDLREKFGIFRQNAKIVPMGSDTRSDPRRVSGVSAYFVGEDTAGTQSTKGWDRVRLTAKKLMFLTKYSNELNEDALINIGDDLAGEAAYAFANKEDQCGFNGDGSSTYGGIVGVCQKLLAVNATIANVLGLTVATGTGYASSYNSIVLGDFNKVVATLPEYADDAAKWYCSRFFWGSVMQRLAMAAGGNNVGNITGGARTKEFAGYAVQTAQVLPKTPAINQVVALFGDLRRAASLGDRRSFTISLSDSALNAFEQDEMAMRATERFDINVHDVGESSTGTARDPVNGLMAGPIVALITAAS
jgi:HK97 family phage major capsid protein